MTSRSIQNYFRFIIFMLIVSCYLPLLFNNLPPIIRSHHVWTSIWIMSVLVFFKHFSKLLVFKILLFYGLIMMFLFFVLWKEVDDLNKTTIVFEYYEVFIGLSVFCYFLVTKDYEGWVKLTKWCFIFIIITSIMSIFSSFMNPDYARNLYGISGFTYESEREQILSYKKYGGGSYGFAGALMCLIPVVIYYLKNLRLKRINRIYLLFVLILILYALIRMQIFANVLIAVVAIIVSFAGSKNIRVSIFIISVLIVFAIIIPNTYYAIILSQLSDYFEPDSEMYYKLTDMAKFINYGFSESTGTGDRSERNFFLIEAFLDGPIFGSKLYTNGHLHWMNKLAVYGLSGTLLFLYIIWIFYKSARSILSVNYKFYFIVALLALIGLGFIKTLAGREMWYAIFIIVPGAYFLTFNYTRSLYSKHD